MEAVIEADVLGVRLRRRTRQSVLDELLGLLADGGPHSVYFVHASTANLAFEDPVYREALNRGHLVLNDGIGVRWAARWRGLMLDENLVGTDLLPELFSMPASRQRRVYLLGGKPGIAERAATALGSRYPAIEVAGFSHGHFSAEEELAVVEGIRNSKADMLLVAMGNPRQELFIDRHLHEFGCAVAVGVGGLFDHLAGDLRRAPQWVRRLGFEWCQLLLQQPQKWRRYLLGIPKFVWRASNLAPSEPTRKLTASFLALGLGLALALAAGEALVRAARPQILERYPAGLYIPSATRQYKLRPGFRGVFRYPEFETKVRVSDQGLREERSYMPFHPGSWRILAVGDSFTMAYSVGQPNTWVRVLERLLNTSGSGRRWEVINGGVPGYSTWQELAYLGEEGLALRPDVVLLGFFIGNDIADNARPALPVELREGRLISSGFRNGLLPFPMRLFLARHSDLYHLAHSVGAKPLGRGLPYGDSAEEGWRQTNQLISRFSRMCREQGVRGIVVLMPERVQVEPDAARQFAAGLGIPFDPGGPDRHMREVCARAGLEVVDLLDELAGRSGLYFPQDGHWTERGNSAAAWALFEYLRHDTT